MEFNLPDKFLLGVSINDRRDQHADADLMSAAGIQSYCFNVEWSRILPEPGNPDEAVISRYRDELLFLLEKGISPLLTIHHFSNPLWFEEKGGFSKQENTRDFLDFVILVVERFGDLVSDYITINEPNVYAAKDWFSDNRLPDTKSLSQTFRVLENMAYCHMKAYELIHRMRWVMDYNDTMVGFASHIRIFDPQNAKNPIHRLKSKFMRWIFQDVMTRAMMIGEFKRPLHNWGNMPKRPYADFIGLNYYGRSSISGFAGGACKNDLACESYPEGLVRCAKELHTVLNLPIWVTAGSSCGNDDSLHSRCICDHLKEISTSDLPFARYYHRFPCGAFEATGVHHAKSDSAAPKEPLHFYSRIIAEKGVSHALYNEFVGADTNNVK